VDERVLNVRVLDARDELVGIGESALLDRAMSLAKNQFRIFARDRFLNVLRRSRGIGGSFRTEFTAGNKRRRLREGDE
jgi:hypothetical protein